MHAWWFPIKRWPCEKDNIFSIDYKNVKIQPYWCNSRFPFWGIQVTIHMKNEDECFFCCGKCKKLSVLSCTLVFLAPIKLHFGLWYWSCSFALRICYINKSIKFILVVIVIDFTIFTKGYLLCISIIVSIPYKRTSI